MARRWDGQVAWITGGGSGIGRALAEQLAAEGARVVVSGRRQERLDEVVAAIRAAGGAASAAACDVTDDSDVKRVVDGIVAEHGGLDLVVANAGYSVAGRMTRLTVDDLRRQLEVNVVGAYATVHHALPHVIARKGRVAIMGSAAHVVPAPGTGAYSASKAAVHALAMTLAVELAGTGASCTVIHPGLVESEIAQVDNAGRHHPDREDKRPARLMWPTDAAARVMLRGLHRRRTEVVVTGHGKLAVALGRHLPALLRAVIGSIWSKP